MPGPILGGGIANGGPLGTPSGGVLTNATGLPQSGVTNLVSDLALKAPLASPSFTTPSIGAASATSLNIGAGTQALLAVHGANGVFDSYGQGFIGTTDSFAIDKGGQLTLGGVRTGTSVTAFGGISARKENATDGLFQGYLSLIVSNGTSLVEGARLDSSRRFTFRGVAQLKGYTVAALPAGTQGDTAFVTDALAPAFLAIVVGGGAVVTTVFYNGTNWVAQ